MAVLATQASRAAGFAIRMRGTDERRATIPPEAEQSTFLRRRRKRESAHVPQHTSHHRNLLEATMNVTMKKNAVR